jgi:hypothetical protein
MAKTFSYNPIKITDYGIDQMRFELGDTEVDGENDTCALCDEEYQAMIDRANKDEKGWKWATFLCLKAIRMKFSFEVSSSVGGMSLSLQERYKVWDDLYLRMMKSFESPKANPEALGENRPDEGHYFNLGQGSNPRTGALFAPWRGKPYA